MVANPERMSEAGREWKKKGLVVAGSGILISLINAPIGAFVFVAGMATYGYGATKKK